MDSKTRRLQFVLIAVAAFVILVVMPCLNAFVPPHVMGPDGVALKDARGDLVSHPWHVQNFTINQWGKYLCYAVLAVSVDLLWGFTGLLSLGQALFFALGGYMMGMHLMRMIGDLGQHKKPIPDFLVFLGWEQLPSFWVPFSSFIFAMLMVIVLPAVVAGIFGFLAFRSRIKGVYFSILTQALTYGAALMFFRNDLLMGGNNGFTDFKFILGADIRSAATQRALYVATGILLVVVFLLSRWLTRTKFGLVQRAIRDSETRVLFSGYAAANYKLFVFVVCAIIAGLAGALYVPQVGIINPSEMETAKSLEIIVWVAVGGRGTLLGPIIGAVGVNALKSWATTGAVAAYWPIILGVLFILVVLLMPKGIVGLPAQIRGVIRKFKSRSTGAEIAVANHATP
jgi:urea transport system permease protein